MFQLLRSDPENPFRNVSYVFVPYCTGDFHAGDNVAHHLLVLADFVTHHVGGRNVRAALERVVATFSDAKNVYIAGDSAGGYAVMLNFWRFAEAFPRAKVSVINDSGPPLQPRADLWQAWKTAWRLTAPQGCTACDDRLDAYLDYNASRAPDLRFGLVSFADDPSIASYLGLTAAEFASGMNALLERMPRIGPYHKYFILPGSAHVGLLQLPADAGVPDSGGVRLSPELKRWVRQMAENDPAWTNVR
jgi:hypothetical protein